MKISKITFQSTLVLISLLLAINTHAQQYSKITYVHSEADGTAFAATDERGNIEWQIDHYPYGAEYSNTEVARKSDISFAGKPYDEEIGLSYFGARWYDPDIGRFTGMDPMPVDPNDYRTFNRYAYAFNNPYKYQDPDGRLAFLIPVAIFLAKELAAEAASRATGGATDFLSVRRLGTKAIKAGAKAARNSRNKLARTNGCCCFDEGTLVKTETGFSPIEDVRVGDLVYSYDEETKQTSLKPVSELFITDPKPLYELSLADNQNKVETFVVTDNHPYWVLEQGWVDSADLKPGMKIRSFEAGELDVVSLELKSEVKPTYNFTVADTNTYFVGETEALVHNCDCVKRNPNEIELSHPVNLGTKFRNTNEGSVGELAEKLKANPKLADDIPPISIAKIKGKEFSANNKRLRAHQEAGVEIRTKPASKRQTQKIKARLQRKR